MLYAVPNVPMIPQDKDMACWYASAQMVIGWRRKKKGKTTMLDPSEIPVMVEMYKADNGIDLESVISFGQTLGLREVPLMTPTPQAMNGWLHKYGPLWAAGLKSTKTNNYNHVVVITGIADTGVQIQDPEPKDHGYKGWKNWDWLTTLLSEGADNGIAANFLHCPA